MPPIYDLLVAAGVICTHDGAVLLVREKGRWNPPMGCREPGEVLFQTARREALEEAGVEVDVGDIAYVIEYIESDGHSRTLQVFFAARLLGGQPRPNDPDGEVEDARFVPFHDIDTVLTASHHRLALLSWLSGRRAGHHFVDRSVGGHRPSVPEG